MEAEHQEGLISEEAIMRLISKIPKVDPVKMVVGCPEAISSFVERIALRTTNDPGMTYLGIPVISRAHYPPGLVDFFDSNGNLVARYHINVDV